MLYVNIKPLKSSKAEFLQQRVAAQAATLRLARFFFDKLFKPEIDADTRGAFWDSGLVGAVQSIHRYRDPASTPSSRTYATVSNQSLPWRTRAT